jgi:hypothetical protein
MVRKKISMKMNCWEFKNCGRQAGGHKVAELGICPATTTRSLDSIHGGQNAGRACWVVAGTLCKGQAQGTFAQKYKNCESCDFYSMVRTEESPRVPVCERPAAKNSRFEAESTRPLPALHGDHSPVSHPPSLAFSR